jgi:hypothetical protein
MNRVTKLGAIIFGLSQLVAVESALASTLTFEGALVDPTKVAILSDGFVFTTATSGTHALVADYPYAYGPTNGTHYLVYDAASSFENFSTADVTKHFDLTSIALGGWLGFDSVDGHLPQLLTVTGLHADGKSITSTLQVTTKSFETYALTGFTNLTSVSLGKLAQGYVAVDNIVVNSYVGSDSNITTPVSEPETLALLLTGLGLVGAVGRRKAKKSVA